VLRHPPLPELASLFPLPDFFLLIFLFALATSWDA
jgi:hypothetical protein